MVSQARTGIFKSRYPIGISAKTLLSALVVASKPKGFKFASKTPQWPCMQEEIDALKSNQTWDLVPRPPNTNIVGSK